MSIAGLCLSRIKLYKMHVSVLWEDLFGIQVPASSLNVWALLTRHLDEFDV